MRPAAVVNLKSWGSWLANLNAEVGVDQYELKNLLTSKAQAYLEKIGRREAAPTDGWDARVVWVPEGAQIQAERLEGGSYPLTPHDGDAYIVVVRDLRHGGLLVRAAEKDGDWTFDSKSLSGE